VVKHATQAELFFAQENQRRSIQIAFRVNRAEMAKLRAMAFTHKMSVSNMIRIAIVNFPDKR
jgi:hypothetical protein